MFFANRVPPQARNAYRIDASSGMLSAVMLGISAPFFSVIARGTLRATPFEISLLSVAPLAGQVLSLLWANLMEGRRKLPFVVWSLIAARSLLFLAPLTTTHSTFVAMVCVFYAIGSITGPAYSAIIKEIYPDSDRARIMGYARVCTVAVLIVVSPIAGPLLRGENYRFVFPVAALFGIISALSFSRIPARETHGEQGVPLAGFVRNAALILREDRGFRWFCTGVFISGFANLMVGPLMQLYQVDVLGVNTDWAAVYAVVSYAVLMVSYVRWGSYIDRRTAHEALVVCTFLLALIPAAYCLVSKAWMLIPLVVLGGVISSGMELAYTNGILEFAPADRITHYQGVFLSLMGIRGLVAPFVGVALVNNLGLPTKSAFVLSSGLMMLATAVQIAAVGRHPQSPPSASERPKSSRR